jgi:hypothetical protein
MIQESLCGALNIRINAAQSVCEAMMGFVSTSQKRSGVGIDEVLFTQCFAVPAEDTLDAGGAGLVGPDVKKDPRRVVVCLRHPCRPHAKRAEEGAAFVRSA